MGNKITKSFQELIELKYNLYNSVFLTLPLTAVEQTGIILPLLQEACEKGFKEGKSPVEIFDLFFNIHHPKFSEKERISFLFKLIQYIERQIVVIDALEDAAYEKIHNTEGPDSWAYLKEGIKTERQREEIKKILSEFGIRVVLTAHPTQFYPEQVLKIITDLTNAVAENDMAYVRDLLQQLGKTPFFPKQKPSPLDEADRLIRYLEKIFYPAVGELLDKIGENYSEQLEQNMQLINLGFWPGGDRDGNPFVTVDITKKVAERLRYALFSNYYTDIKQLRRRLSFSGIYDRLNHLQNLFSKELSQGMTGLVDLKFLLNEIEEIEEILIKEHRGLFLDKLISFKKKVINFGFHFASLDIRQDSRILRSAFLALQEAHPDKLPADLFERSEDDVLSFLYGLEEQDLAIEKIKDPVLKDTLASFKVIKEIQELNGELGCHRYIISNCRGPIDISLNYAFFKLLGWKESDLTVDIIPLFETINDLDEAGRCMTIMYNHPIYGKHLANRKNKQTIMFGFSDGTKDGGYLTANWAIYTAKERITKISRDANIEVLFFDGRGGPPARGGGNSHLFYSSLGSEIENKQIQMTVQGQTISAHYGIKAAAVHNLELLLTAGLKNNLKREEGMYDFSADQRALVDELSKDSYQAYEDFKNHPLFMPYLIERSALKYIGKTNIGSRPAKRGKNNDEYKFEDLRAIPFVGAWSQLKQIIPGFYGLGSALKKQEEQGNLQACISLYHDAPFFRALIANSMQSMSKTNLSLTSYLKKDEKFSGLWEIIREEYELSRQMVLKISGLTELLEDNPRSRLSIQLREKAVLPLLTTQQYALMKIQEEAKNNSNSFTELYEKVVTRTLFGNINASKNSV